MSKPSKHNAPIINPSRKTSFSVSSDRPSSSSIRAEKPRSQVPMIVFTLGILIALVVVPFLILRPKETSYKLLSWAGATVERSTISETASSPGTVVPQDTQDINARTSGTLETITVKEGDDVKVGQVLIRITAPDLEKARREAQTALRTAEEKLGRTQLDSDQRIREAQTLLETANQKISSLTIELKNVQAVFNVGGETKLNLDSARNKLEATRVEVKAAQNKLNNTRGLARIDLKSATQTLNAAQAEVIDKQRDLEKTTLKAPIAGRVVALNVQTGKDVRGGDKLLTITGLKDMKIEGLVDESAAARVKSGQSVRVSIDNADFNGRVTKVASQVVKADKTSTVKIEVQLETRPKILLPNTSVGLEITVGQKVNVPSLPRGPYLSTGSEVLAYVLNTDGTRAERRQVIFGASDANKIEILKGLEPGERIITSSYEAFKDQPNIDVVPSGELK
jgi:HlyD family secretion protein